MDNFRGFFIRYLPIAILHSVFTHSSWVKFASIPGLFSTKRPGIEARSTRLGPVFNVATKTICPTKITRHTVEFDQSSQGCLLFTMAAENIEVVVLPLEDSQHAGDVS